MNEHTNLLEIKDLTVHYVTVDGTVHAVENLNLTLPEGKTHTPDAGVPENLAR